MTEDNNRFARLDVNRFTARWISILTVALSLAACATRETTTVSKPGAGEPRGFFGRMWDHVTVRECNAGRLICPYGLGPAGEACECIDPSGYVLKGRTVK